MTDKEVIKEVREVADQYLDAELKLQELLDELPNAEENCDCQNPYSITLIYSTGFDDVAGGIEPVNKCLVCGGDICRP